MQKTYPVLYNQNNYNVLLGFSPSITIAQAGCFVTSSSMKACFYGHQIDPESMNQLLKDKQVFVQVQGSDKDLLPDNAVSQVFPDISYLKTIDYEPIPTDLQNIKTLLDDAQTTLTIRINLGGGNLHFVEAVACDGVSLHIANPLSGQVEDFSQRYGNPVTANLHVLVFKGPAPVQAVASDTPSPLAVRFSQAIQKSNNFDSVADLLGINSDDRVTPLGGQTAVGKIQTLLKEVDTLSTELDEARKAASSVTPSSEVPSTTVVTTTTATTATTQPTFVGGTNPVSSTQDAKATSSKKQVKASSIQSGRVSFAEFVKAIVNTLFN